MLDGSCILQETRGSQVLPFSILIKRTVWFGLWVYSIFSKNKTHQFHGRLEFSENKTNQFQGRLEFS
jgi:hypothetical protein